MRRGRRGVTIIAALGLGALLGDSARAAPQLRAHIVQRGDFVLFGNTLAHDCSPATPPPLIGSVGDCGDKSVDSAADVLWRADSPLAGAAAAEVAFTAAEARSSAVLLLPPGAAATHAFLFWASQLAIAGGDANVEVTRPGFFDVELAADVCYAAADGSYLCAVDVTDLVLEFGPGLFRVGGVDVRPFAHLADEEIFAAWWMVVAFARDDDPLRSISVFESLEPVLPLLPLEAELDGFIVPPIGIQGSLALVGCAGDHAATGDSVFIADVPLSDALNPADDFFNGTRSTLGLPVAIAGDLPRLSGLPASTSGVDLDVVDISALLQPVQTSLPLRVTTVEDPLLLATAVVSVTTAVPVLVAHESIVDLDGGAFIPGDVVEVTVEVTNIGSDVAVDVVLTDALPPGLAAVPGSLEIVEGPVPGVLSDEGGDDLGECVEDVVVVRLGVDADPLAGGALAVGQATVVRFRAVIADDAAGLLVHQAAAAAAGLLGAPPLSALTDATELWIEACDEFTPCPWALPICDLAAVPNVCVECLTDLDCAANELCDPLTRACLCVPSGLDVCDGLDNDCDGFVDEGFAVGAPCEAGLGECLATGHLACDPFGAAVCDAVPSLPTPEVCDGLDNDCDGVVDGFCGVCLLDVDCGFPGVVCDAGACVPGCRGTGDPCPFGLLCSSLDASIGECLPPDLDDEPDEKSNPLLGCTCDGRPVTGGFPLVLAATALLRTRRRR